MAKQEGARSAGPIMRIAAVVVIVALAAVVGWLAWGYFSRDDAHTDAASAVGITPPAEGEPESNGAGAPVVWGGGTGPAAPAVRAAAGGVEAMFSYTYDKADQQLGDAAQKLTDEFRSTFEDYVSSQVVPQAQEKKSSVAASVVGAAPVRLSDDSASVLVFLDQVAKTEGADQTAFTPSQVMVSLDRSGDGWLISDVERISY